MLEIQRILPQERQVLQPKRKLSWCPRETSLETKKKRERERERERERDNDLDLLDNFGIMILMFYYIPLYK